MKRRNHAGRELVECPTPQQTAVCAKIKHGRQVKAWALPCLGQEGLSCSRVGGNGKSGGEKGWQKGQRAKEGWGGLVVNECKMCAGYVPGTVAGLDYMENQSC